jgi:hypothetical protein
MKLGVTSFIALVVLVGAFSSTQAADQLSSPSSPMGASRLPWRPGLSIPLRALHLQQQQPTGPAVAVPDPRSHQDLPGLHPSLVQQHVLKGQAAAWSSKDAVLGRLPQWLTKTWLVTPDSDTPRLDYVHRAPHTRRLLVSLQSTPQAGSDSTPIITASSSNPAGGSISSDIQAGLAGGTAEPNQTAAKQRPDSQSRGPAPTPDRSADKQVERPQQEPSDHNPSDALADAPPEVQAAVKQLNPAASEVVPVAPSVHLADVADASSP